MLSQTQNSTQDFQKNIARKQSPGFIFPRLQASSVACSIVFRGGGFDFFLSADVFSGDSFSPYFLN